MAMATMTRCEPFRDSLPLLARPPELRARAATDGYLLLRGLLPRDDVLSMRALVLAHCRSAGWTDVEAPMLSGRVLAGSPPILEGQSEAWACFYRLLYSRRELHAFNQHPALLAACAALFDAPVLAHPRLIARVMFPGTARWTTPPHQDCFYIGGTAQTWTAWIPLGDCPAELGGLAIAAGSHRLGPQPVKPAEGAGGHGVAADESLRWVADDFSAGDVLLFHSWTIHQARDNRSEDRLRLSCDFRYQDAREPVSADSLHPHYRGPGMEWSDVHAAWPADEPLRDYWQRMALQVV